MLDWTLPLQNPFLSSNIIRGSISSEVPYTLDEPSQKNSHSYFPFHFLHL